MRYKNPVSCEKTFIFLKNKLNNNPKAIITDFQITSILSLQYKITKFN